MKITYDQGADAAYIYFKPEETDVVRTEGDWPFHVDLDANGEVVGIEIMDAGKVLTRDYLKTIE